MLDFLVVALREGYPECFFSFFSFPVISSGVRQSHFSLTLIFAGADLQLFAGADLQSVSSSVVPDLQSETLITPSLRGTKQSLCTHLIGNF